MLILSGVPAEGVLISADRSHRGADGGGRVLHPGRLHPGVQLGGGARLLPPARTARCHARQGAGVRGTSVRERRLARGKYLHITLRREWGRAVYQTFTN